MKEASLIPAKTQNLLDEALEFFHSMKDVKFENDEQYDNGVELCKKVKTHLKNIEIDRKNLVKPFNDKLKLINSSCKHVTSKLENAERVLKNGMSKYFQIREQKRIAEQKRLEAEAEERRRQEQERARREAEKVEKYRKEGRNEMADRAEARKETAETISETITAPIVNNSAKVAGTSFKTVYRVNVKNKVDAIRNMVMNPILLGFIEINITGLEKAITALKGNIVIPGIEIIKDQQVSIRT